MHTRKKVKLAFEDFWNGYNPKEEYICSILQEHYDIEIDNNNPDFIFCSCFGCTHLKPKNTVRIYFTGENVFPNLNICDYSVSFMRDSIGGRNFYFPAATRYDEDIVPPPLNEQLLRRKFCNFIYSQDTMGEGAILRKEICQEIMKYQHVDCPGKVLHNIDAPELSIRTAIDWKKSKIDYLSNYKFTIAVENSNTDGYITEKLIHPLLAGSIPIYWGSEGNVTPFPKECMICVSDYPTIDSLIARIKEVNENDDLYMEMCKANPIRTGQITSQNKDFLAFFDKIYEKGTSPIIKDPLNFDSSRILYNRVNQGIMKKLKHIVKKRIHL